MYSHLAAEANEWAANEVKAHEAEKERLLAQAKKEAEDAERHWAMRAEMLSLQLSEERACQTKWKSSAQRSLQEEASKCAQLQQDRDAMKHSARSEVDAMRREVHLARAHSSTPDPSQPPQTFDLDSDGHYHAPKSATATTTTLKPPPASLTRAPPGQGGGGGGSQPSDGGRDPHLHRTIPADRRETEHLSVIASLTLEHRTEMMILILHTMATTTEAMTTSQRTSGGRNALSTPRWTPGKCTN